MTTERNSDPMSSWGAEYAQRVLCTSMARRIIDIALAHARRLRFAPLTVAVLSIDGTVLVAEREDDCAPLRLAIAVGKAESALGMGVGTREIARRFSQSPSFFGAVSTMAQIALLPSPGGVLIRDDRAHLIGAVGVSGESADRDEQCAIFGVRRVGLLPDGGEDASAPADRYQDAMVDVTRAASRSGTGQAAQH